MASEQTRYLLITGASRGIGAAIARQAAADGWHVAVNYTRDAAAAQAVADAVRAAGRQAITVQADVADEAQVRAMFQAVDAAGGLAGLVNNAGVVGPKARLDEMDMARWQRMFGINVFGTLLCAREAVRRLSTRHGGPGGPIVNVSSIASRLGSPGEYVDYAASKGAVDSLTVGLAREVAGEGVRVNAVNPGLIETEIHASGGQPDRLERLAPMVPMRRPGTADEVAATVCWLLSPAAGYVTGTMVEVGGGR